VWRGSRVVFVWISPVLPRVEWAPGMSGAWRRAAKSVVPRCEHVFVNIGTCRQRGQPTVESSAACRPECRVRPKRVVGYARSRRWIGGTIEPVASRSGTPEHRLGRDAAVFFRPACAGAAAALINRMKMSLCMAILTRASVSHRSREIGTVGRRRSKSDIENLRTSGESCPTQ
jgi:hypothetical protein